MKLNGMVDSAMSEVLSDYMGQNGVKTGDTTPAQVFRWDHIVQDMTNLMEEITEQNKQKVEKIELPMPYVLTMLDALRVIKKHKLYGLMGDDEEEVKDHIDTVIEEFLEPVAMSTGEVEIVFYD